MSQKRRETELVKIQILENSVRVDGGILFDKIKFYNKSDFEEENSKRRPVSRVVFEQSQTPTANADWKKELMAFAFDGNEFPQFLTTNKTLRFILNNHKKGQMVLICEQCDGFIYLHLEKQHNTNKPNEEGIQIEHYLSNKSGTKINANNISEGIYKLTLRKDSRIISTCFLSEIDGVWEESKKSYQKEGKFVCQDVVEVKAFKNGLRTNPEIVHENIVNNWIQNSVRGIPHYIQVNYDLEEQQNPKAICISNTLLKPTYKLITPIAQAACYNRLWDILSKVQDKFKAEKGKSSVKHMKIGNVSGMTYKYTLIWIDK